MEYSYNGRDVATAPYGDYWRTLRKIFVTELLSSKKLPSFRLVREEEIERMISSIKTRSDPNSAINISELTSRLAHNVIFQVAFGYRSEGEYGEKSKFHTDLEVVNATVADFYAADYFPGFGWIDELTGQMRKLKRGARELDEFFKEVISEHLKDDRREDLQEDIVDVLLRLWKRELLTMDHVKGALMNIFVGATDTTAATITWAMAELARNQNVMRKAQDEVRKVIGKNGMVKESDLPQLQYVKFIVNETMRLHPPVPLLIPRETIQLCEINGYSIRPKTRVFVNVWAIGRDEDAWEKPEEFNPDRFTGSLVDYKGHCFQFLPFGAGRRVCPGIDFGVANVELALANLLYSFNWELPSGMKKEDIEMYDAPGVIAHKKTALNLLASNYQGVI